MAMVSADGSSQSFGGLTAQIGWFGLRVGGHPALSLHSSNEPGELSQWLCHDDSTINIVSNIVIIITLSALERYDCSEVPRSARNAHVHNASLQCVSIPPVWEAARPGCVKLCSDAS